MKKNTLNVIKLTVAVIILVLLVLWYVFANGGRSGNDAMLTDEQQDGGDENTFVYQRPVEDEFRRDTVSEF